MPTNDFVPFCPQDTGTNLLEQSAYLADPQLQIGNQTGIARSVLVNKALRQGTYVTSQIAQFVSNQTNTDVVDNAQPLQLLAQIEASFMRLTPIVQTLTASTTVYQKYTFFISSGNVTVGATYTNNSFTFTALQTVASGTQILMVGTGAPSANGVLTKATGTGDSTVTFYAVRSSANQSEVLLCSGAPITLSLLAASQLPSKQYTFKKTDSTIANIITISANGSDTIDGKSTFTLNNQYDDVVLFSDGVSNWNVISSNTNSAKIYASYQANGQSIASGGALTQIDNMIEVSDSHSAMNASTGVYTVPVTRVYNLNFRMALNPNNGGQQQLHIQKNGVDIGNSQNDYIGTTANDSYGFYMQAYPLTAGDQITWLVQVSNGGTTQVGYITEMSIVAI